MGKRMRIDDLWDYLPEDVKSIAADETRDGRLKWWAYANIPKPAGSHSYKGVALFSIGIAIDYDGDWKDSLRERPEDYADMVGMFGKAWDGDKEPTDESAMWGYLREYMHGKEYPFYGTFGIYTHFRPCLPPARIGGDE